MKELEITKGKYELIFQRFYTEPEKICTGIGINEKVEGGVYTTMICNTMLPESDDEYIKQGKRIEAEMTLFADAGNTAQRCGLMPFELLRQRDELRKALKQLVHLHGCDQEGLLSGQPTPEQWYKSVEQAETAIKSTER